ncbi:MAG: lysophospholipid acyltransferase family protein [Lachnospiraceae bacterium]
MKRIVLMVVRLLYIIPYYFYKLHQFNKQTPVPYEEANALLKHLCRNCSRVGRVKVHAQGVENVPLQGGFLLTPNHQGMFDGLVFIDTCPRAIGLIFKEEVKDIILLKQVAQATGSLPMDRTDLKQSMKVIIEATAQVKSGRGFLVFPEGTRSKDGNELLDFKGGSFKIATKSKVPIIPCALIDSFKPFDSGTIKRVDVYVKYLTPICYEEYKDWSSVEIAQEVKRRIEEAISEYEQQV